MSGPVTPGEGWATLERLSRTLRVAYPALGPAVDAVGVELDRLGRIETAAAAVSETFVQHDYGEGDTLEHLAALAVALEGSGNGPGVT